MSTDSNNRNDQPSRGVGLASLLFDRTILLLALMFVVMVAVLIWHQARLEDRLVESTALEEARRYTDALATFRTLYTREVVGTVKKQGITVTYDYDKEQHEGKAIPLPATLSMKIGNEMAKKEVGGQTALYSAYPFPHREQEWQERDKFGKDAWEAVNNNKDAPFHRFEQREGKRWLRYATADLMRPACVNCHNTHPETPKNDWKEGDVRGVLEVSLPLETAEATAKDNLQESIVFTIGVGGLALIGLVIVTGRLRRSSVELEHRVEDRTAELQRSVDELAEFNRMAVGRELQMIELKNEINELCVAAGQSPRYDEADNASAEQSES